MAETHTVQIIIEFPTEYPSEARAKLMAERYKAELAKKYPNAHLEDHIWSTTRSGRG